jgi:DNA-directed RNA polymerase I, II, and III subunit RPABC2
MDEFAQEPEVDEAELEEPVEDELEAVEELDEAQRAEAADLAKLLRQHPEIWIPYEEQVLDQLNVNPPGEAAPDVKSYSVRDTSVLDQKHSTYPFLTNYERTKCISFRASQLNNGAKPYVLVPEGMTDSYEIAKMELEAKRLPYIIKRPLPDGSFEAWRLADLLIF